MPAGWILTKYPNVKSGRIQFTSRDLGRPQDDETHFMSFATMDRMSEDCPTDGCKGKLIPHGVEFLIMDGKTEGEISGGSTELGGVCLRRFKGKVTIEYK